MIEQTQEETKVENVITPEPETEVSDKPSNMVFHASAQDAALASMVKSFETPMTYKDVKQVVKHFEPLDYTEPHKLILDKVKKLHPQFKLGEDERGNQRMRYKYRFISTEKIRLSKAFQIEYWQPVNRTNHPNLTSDLINDALGCVELMGDILCFRHREIDEKFMEKNILKHRDAEEELENKDKYDERFYKTSKYASKFDDTPLIQSEDLENKDFVQSVMTEE